MAKFMTFQEIYEAVMLAIGDAQYSRKTEVKAVCNMIYLNEICQCDDLYPLFWLLECDDAKKTKAPATITGITAATPPVVSAAAHGLRTGDVVSIYNVGGMTELNKRIFHFTMLTAGTGSLQDLSKAAIPGAGYTAYTTGGEIVHRGTLIEPCAKVLTANWHGYNKGMGFIGPEQIEAESGWMDESTSRPLKMMHRQIYTSSGDEYYYLLWYQGADAVYDLRLWYEKQIMPLEEEDDVPLLPAKFHPAIIAGAVMRLGVNAVQVEAGVVWPSIYKISIDAIRSANRQWWETQKPFERSGPFLI